MSQKPQIIALIGYNANSALWNASAAFNHMMAGYGFATHIVDLMAEDGLQRLVALLKQPTLFVYGYAGVGSALESDGMILWDKIKTPFLSLMYDHPFYNPEQHKITSRYVANCYFTRDFYEVQKNYIKSPQPLLLFPSGEPATPDAPPPLPWSSRDLHYLYLKTGSNPAIIAEKINALQPDVQSIIWDAIAIHKQRSDATLEEVVAATFNIRRAVIEENIPVFMICIRYCDEYMRAWRSTEMAKALLPYPGVICGAGWEHIDFSAGHTRYLCPVNSVAGYEMFRRAKFLINTNPVACDLLHERISAGLKIPNAIITDGNEYIRRNFSDVPSLFAFDWADTHWQEKMGDFMHRHTDTPPDFTNGQRQLKQVLAAEPLVSAILSAVKEIRAQG
jgi:hypothetical protein